jgi:hypothetical protein
MVAPADTSKSTFYKDHHKHVSAWIPMRDYEVLNRLARDNKVTLAAYLRAIIVDAVEEELCL